MQDDEFGDNPFAGLDPAIFPTKNQAPQSAYPSREATDQDRELFLKSLANMKINGKAENFSKGFLLADHGIKLSLTKNAQTAPRDRKRAKKEKNTPKNKMEDRAAKHLPEEKKEEPGDKKQDETEAFLWAMRNARPLKAGGRSVIPDKRRKYALAEKIPQFSDLVDENLEFALMNCDEYIEGYVTGLDENILNRLREGQFGTEAHLDLHGLNSMQAFEAVRDFIRASWFKGLRNVLIVPGRGLNSPNGRSILRQKLQQWLPHDPFKRVVLAFCTARPRDGGPGSIYVLLRNYRKKGRVYWERMPPDPDLYL